MVGRPSYSEDPYLAGRIAASDIEGIQGQHVIATARCYVLNDQETHRDSVNVVVSERAARGDYLPPFEASVKQGGAGAIMCSYNRIGGRYAARSRTSSPTFSGATGASKDSS